MMTKRQPYSRFYRAETEKDRKNEWLKDEIRKYADGRVGCFTLQKLGENLHSFMRNKAGYTATEVVCK